MVSRQSSEVGDLRRSDSPDFALDYASVFYILGGRPTPQHMFKQGLVVKRGVQQDPPLRISTAKGLLEGNRVPAGEHIKEGVSNYSSYSAC